MEDLKAPYKNVIETQIHTGKQVLFYAFYIGDRKIEVYKYLGIHRCLFDETSVTRNMRLDGQYKTQPVSLAVFGSSSIEKESKQWPPVFLHFF